MGDLVARLEILLELSRTMSLSWSTPKIDGSDADLVRMVNGDQQLKDLLGYVDKSDQEHPEVTFQDLVNKHTKDSAYDTNTVYADYIDKLPFDVKPTPLRDLTEARAILDAKIVGLNHVKQSVMEYLATTQLLSIENKPSAFMGRVMCFVGEPGTGKTAFAVAMAEAMGKKVGIIPLVAVSDLTWIKGARRHFVGSRPGVVMRVLRELGVSDPVIVLDGMHLPF